MRKALESAIIGVLLAFGTSISLPVANAATSKKSQVLVCQPSVKYYFDVNGAEQDFKLGDFKTIVNAKDGTISRCGGSKPCDKYSVNITTSGIYTNIQTKSNNGMLMKINYSGLYMEFVTIGFDTIAYYGTCKVSSL